MAAAAEQRYNCPRASPFHCYGRMSYLVWSAKFRTLSSSEGQTDCPSAATARLQHASRIRRRSRSRELVINSFLSETPPPPSNRPEAVASSYQSAVARSRSALSPANYGRLRFLAAQRDIIFLFIFQVRSFPPSVEISPTRNGSEKRINTRHGEMRKGESVTRPLPAVMLASPSYPRANLSLEAPASHHTDNNLPLFG